MNNSTIRTILRCIHLVVCIPILGYIYGQVSDVQQYAGVVRYVFVPVILLSGLWMYSAPYFAVGGVALWLGAFHFFGYGAAVLSQVVLFIARILVTRIYSRPNFQR